MSYTPSTATITSSAVCPTCVFGATAATLHSFPYTFVETLTATVQPYYIPCENGSTSAYTATLSGSPELPFTPPAGDNVFTATEQLTWNISQYPMTYPQTYVQYLGFEKDLFLTNPTLPPSGGFCTGSKIPAGDPVTTNVEPASLIAQVTAPIWATSGYGGVYFSVPVPETLLSYLAQLENSHGATDLTDINKCAILTTSYQNYQIPSHVSATPTCDTTYSTTTVSSYPGGSTCTDEPSYVTTEVATFVSCTQSVRQFVMGDDDTSAFTSFFGTQTQTTATTVKYIYETPRLPPGFPGSPTVTATPSPTRSRPRPSTRSPSSSTNSSGNSSGVSTSIAWNTNSTLSHSASTLGPSSFVTPR